MHISPKDWIIKCFGYHILIGASCSLDLFKVTLIFDQHYIYIGSIIECWFLYYIHRFPFDWKNPTGYLIAFIMEYILILNLLFFIICALCHGIGIYILIQSLTDDVKTDLKTFIALSKSKRNHVKLLKQLTAFVQFQTIVQKFVLKR